MAGLLEGKVAIVTGAARGIGKAIAEAYAGEGATVVVSDIDEGLAKEMASGINGASAIACDVRSEEQVKNLVDQTVAQHGALHIMVPNAGIGRPVPLARHGLRRVAGGHVGQPRRRVPLHPLRRPGDHRRRRRRPSSTSAPSPPRRARR